MYTCLLLVLLLQVFVYFKRFDDAEELYHNMDRLDLAIGLRSRLGGCRIQSKSP